MENRCPNCNSPLPTGAGFCLHCFTMLNKKAPPESEKVKKNKTALIVICALIIACGVALGFFLNNKPSANKEPESVSVIVSESKSEAESLDEKTSEAVTQKATTEKTTVSETASEETSSEATTQTTNEITSLTTTETTTATTETTKNSTTKKETTTKQEEIIIKNGVLKSYPKSLKASSYTIPYSVTKIEKGAFTGNRNIKTLKFSKRESVSCNWQSLFSELSGLKTIYIYAGTSVDTEGMQYFGGEIIYYYD